MANGLGGTVLPQIQRIFQGGTLPGMTDGQLLERFATRKDEAAFEALLARYGPLVLTVCRNLLRDRDDVDDAFQATFLILVRKAGSIRLEDSLSPWIYAVAYRVATRARANRLLRGTREGPVADLEPHADSADLETHDVSPLLHEELARLPERLRAPIILCYFQGQTHEMAAHQLQWPVGTVRSRMARARALLRERLTRKGVVLSAGFLTTSARQAVAVTVPPRLWAETIQAATRIAAVRVATAGVVSTQAAALMKGVLSTMWLTKLKATVAVVIVGGLIFTGMAALVVQTANGDQAQPADASPTSVDHPKADAKQPASTLYSRTYYVGDLIGPSNLIDNPNTNAPRIRNGSPGEDFTPVIELLTSSVAPGTWRILEPEGSRAEKQSVNGTAPIGSITPHPLSISLTVRHTAEVHDVFASRIRQLRRITDRFHAMPVSKDKDDAKGPISRLEKQTESKQYAQIAVRVQELPRGMAQRVSVRDNQHGIARDKNKGQFDATVTRPH